MLHLTTMLSVLLTPPFTRHHRLRTHCLKLISHGTRQVGHIQRILSPTFQPRRIAHAPQLLSTLRRWKDALCFQRHTPRVDPPLARASNDGTEARATVAIMARTRVTLLTACAHAANVASRLIVGVVVIIQDVRAASAPFTQHIAEHAPAVRARLQDWAFDSASSAGVLPVCFAINEVATMQDLCEENPAGRAHTLAMALRQRAIGALTSGATRCS